MCTNRSVKIREQIEDNSFSECALADRTEVGLGSGLTFAMREANFDPASGSWAESED